MAKIQRIVDAFRPDVQRLNGRMQSALEPLLGKVERVRHHIASVSVTADLPPRPLPEAAGRDESNWLYASDRDYLDQLAHYPEQTAPKKKCTKKARATVRCACCDTPFEQKRKDARFCSGKCRVAGMRAKSKNGKAPI
jgi:hypothetical protein